MRKRIEYSQNFLRDKNLVSKLLDDSSISNQDEVLEIGAGQGIITEQILRKCKKVVAYEIDENLLHKLAQRFQTNKSLQLVQGDFLVAQLPREPYKLFSNIPFRITSAVIKKLTQADNPPQDAYLIIQSEAAKKFIGRPYDNKNSQLSVLLKPWFELSVSYEFKRNDFFPSPSIDAVLLRIQKRNPPFLKPEEKHLYEDFIVYTFNQFKPNIIEGLEKIFGLSSIIRLAKEIGFSTTSKPSEIEGTFWLSLFNFFAEHVDAQKKQIVRGSARRLFEQQEKLDKIHRTRTDKNWKKYKSSPARS